MKTDTIEQIYGDFLTSCIEAVSIGDTGSFALWVPLSYDDDDLISLRLEPYNEGWLITDDGATYAHLSDFQLNISSDRFLEAWAELTRKPALSAPGPVTDEMVIATFCEEKDLAQGIHTVAQTAQRAEALAYITNPQRQGQRFSTRMAGHIRGIYTAYAEAHHTPVKFGSSRVVLASGRQVHVTASFEKDNKQVAIFQAMGGTNRQAKQDAFEHALPAFLGLKERLRQESLIAIARGTENDWDSGMIKELEPFGRVVFSADKNAVEEVTTDLLAAA